MIVNYITLLGEAQIHTEVGWEAFRPDLSHQLAAYLAYCGEWIGRDELAEVFWPGVGISDARRNLRQVLTRVRKLSWQIDIEATRLRWHINTDVKAFQRALEQDDLDEAISLYRGPLLKDLEGYEDSGFKAWLETERSVLHHRCRAARRRRVLELHWQDNHHRATNLLRPLLEFGAGLVPDEEDLRSYLVACIHADEREAGLAAFESFAEALRRDLGFDLEEETFDLAHSLRTESLGDLMVRFPIPAPPHHLQKHGTKSGALAKAPDHILDRTDRLIGRTSLLQQTQQQLSKKARVLLQGFAGTGKTALAAEAAALHVSETGPVLWLQAGNDPVDTILDAIARTFKQEQVVAREQGETKLRTVLDLLAGSDVTLIVLDDVWNEKAIKQLVKAIPTDIPLLITSRHRFPALQRINVPTHERQAALELLSHFAGSDWITDPAANYLCSTLGDLAFAVRLAGLTLQVDELSPAELLSRIQEAPHELELLEDAPEKGRESTATLLSVSLHLLDDEVKTAFMAFGSLFAPTITPELLELFLTSQHPDSATNAEGALTTLVRRGLAERIIPTEQGLPYYRIHDLSYSYACSKETVKDRQRFAIDACRVYITNHKDDLETLEVVLNNLLGAAEEALRLDEHETLIDIMHLLTVDGTYFSARGHNTRSLDLLKCAIQSAKDFEQLGRAHDLLGRLGDSYQNAIGDFDQAFDAYHEGVELARTAGNRPREAILLSCVGVVRCRQGQEDAEGYSKDAYQLAKATGDDLTIATVLEQWAFVVASQGSWEAANQRFRESLEVLERLENNPDIPQAEIDRRRFYALLNLGETELQLGRFDTSLEKRHQALDIAQKRKNQLWTAHVLLELGEMYDGANEREKAAENLSRALALYRKNEAQVYIERTEVFMKDKQYQ